MPLSSSRLPIVLSTVAVLIASSIIHLVIGWHNRDLTSGVFDWLWP